MASETTTAASEAHPLIAAYEAATSARDAAREAAAECPCEGPSHELDCAAEEALDRAEEALDAAREALEGSDAPRTWEITEEGTTYDEVIASSREEAIEAAKDGVDRANYPDAEGTIWIDVHVRCVETDETESATVQLDPEEPDCTASAHDWQSPHAILGGLEDNPGVWGHGGGVIIEEVCMHCGCARVTDTWAQRPDNGEQGYTTVRYEPGKYAYEVEELADDDEDDDEDVADDDEDDDEDEEAGR